MVDTMAMRLAYAKAHKGLPPSYYEDPIVQGAPSTDVYPFGLYIDGVPYTKTDSVVGIWCINILSNQRSLIATVRKRILCRCGCKSWCTYYALFDWIAWGMEAASSGRHPRVRHDGTPFVDHADRYRKRNAEKAMGHKYAQGSIARNFSGVVHVVLLCARHFCRQGSCLHLFAGDATYWLGPALAVQWIILYNSCVTCSPMDDSLLFLNRKAGGRYSICRAIGASTIRRWGFQIGRTACGLAICVLRTKVGYTNVVVVPSRRNNYLLLV